MLQPCAGPADAMSPMQYSLSTIENWADPPLRGYNSMPALHSVPEDCPIHGLAPAPSPATEQVIPELLISHTWQQVTHSLSGCLLAASCQPRNSAVITTSALMPCGHGYMYMPVRVQMQTCG